VIHFRVILILVKLASLNLFDITACQDACWDNSDCNWIGFNLYYQSDVANLTGDCVLFSDIIPWTNTNICKIPCGADNVAADCNLDPNSYCFNFGSAYVGTYFLQKKICPTDSDWLQCKFWEEPTTPAPTTPAPDPCLGTDLFSCTDPSCVWDPGCGTNQCHDNTEIICDCTQVDNTQCVNTISCYIDDCGDCAPLGFGCPSSTAPPPPDPCSGKDLFSCTDPSCVWDPGCGTNQCHDNTESICDCTQIDINQCVNTISCYIDDCGDCAPWGDGCSTSPPDTTTGEIYCNNYTDLVPEVNKYCHELNYDEHCLGDANIRFFCPVLCLNSDEGLQWCLASDDDDNGMSAIAMAAAAAGSIFAVGGIIYFVRRKGVKYIDEFAMDAGEEQVTELIDFGGESPFLELNHEPGQKYEQKIDPIKERMFRNDRQGAYFQNDLEVYHEGEMGGDDDSWNQFL